MGRALAGNGLRSEHESRPPAPVVYGIREKGLPADRKALIMPAPVHGLLAPLLLAAAGALAHAAAAASSEVPPDRKFCTDSAGPVALGSAQWNGWGRGLENTRYQPEPAIRASDVSKLTLKWAFGYSGGAAAGQPTIVDGRVFVTSASGRVYALDAKSGCIYWIYDAPAGVRTAVSVGEFGPARKVPRPKKSKGKLGLAHLDVQKAPSAARYTRSTLSAAPCCGRRRWMRIPWRASRVRRRCTKTGCWWASRRASRAPRRAMRLTLAAPFAAASPPSTSPPAACFGNHTW